MSIQNNPHHGILLVNKPLHKSSFYLVHVLRKLTGIQKIGHAGTLDPLATGVMVMLVGKTYTTKSDLFLNDDKEYEVVISLGSSTTTYDKEGNVVEHSAIIPSLDAIHTALRSFQGTCYQTPPMFSAKRQNGKRLYEIARQGIEVKREAQQITLEVELVSYTYPELHLYVRCSKGTYIRSIAHDLGKVLGCFGHVKDLKRTRSGRFQIQECLDLSNLLEPNFSYTDHLQRL